MQDPTHKVIRNNLIDEVFQMVQEIRENAPHDPVVDSVCRGVNARLNETKVDFDPNIFKRSWSEVKHFTDLHYTVAVIADDPAICNRVLFLAYRIIGYVGEARRPLYGDFYRHVPDYRLVPPTFRLSVIHSGSLKLDSFGILNFKSEEDLERYNKVLLECYKWSKQLLHSEN
jgi:hypothetical protein